VKKMMMAEVANHSKRNHTDSYFSGKAVVTTSSEEFGSMTPKKPRNTSPRTSPVSPKEKKDKIGERVAALQQLVSPFGKTDTASVLQEASGYIKFLHQQLEVSPSVTAHDLLSFAVPLFLLTPMHQTFAGPELPLHACSSGRRRRA
jgi:hypothetical protein